MVETLRWLCDMATNPPHVWLNEDGTMAETEHTSRFGDDVSHWTLRPHWMHTFLTTKPACGCRRRLGLWRTIYCWDHAGIALGETEADR